MNAGEPAASAGKALSTNRVRKDDVTLSIPPPTLLSNGSAVQITEPRKKFLKYGVPLYQAAMEGDWEAADMIFKEAPSWITSSITKRNDTALHIAAAAKNLEFVTKLVDLMIEQGDRLESPTTVGNTAFCIAASSGDVAIAEVMVGKNRELPNVKGSKNLTPLHMAILLGHKEMVKYLLEVTNDTLLTDDDRIELLTSAIESHLYGVDFHFPMNFSQVCSDMLQELRLQKHES